jgi:ribonuclease P protein component
MWPTFGALMSLQFPHTERLKRRKTIDHLFKSGQSFLAYPVKVVWCKHELDAEAVLQVAVSVPKRNFKRATDRNLLKRRIKEAWRLQKAQLTPETSHAVMLIYVAKEPLSFQEIEKGVSKAIRQLPKAWSANV